MAHVGPPDMRHAIGFALHHPERRSLPVARLDLAAIGRLTFRPADELRWPALRLAREVMRRRGLSGAVFNAAKEAALDAFIARQIGFQQMSEVVERVLDRVWAQPGLDDAVIDLDKVRGADHLARKVAAEIISQR